MTSYAQPTHRLLHSEQVVLDNDSTPLYFYTIKTPSGMVNSDTFSFPFAPPNNPASGFVYMGAHLKDLLQWQVDPVLYPQGAWVSTSPDSLRFARGWGIAGQVTYWVNPDSLGNTANFFWDTTNLRLGIGTGTPAAVNGDARTGITISGTDAPVNGDAHQITIQSAANNNTELEIGLNTSNSHGTVQAYTQGSGPLSLDLEPAGGAVNIGTVAHSSTLTVNGATTSTGLITGNNGLTITAGGAAITGNSSVTGTLTTTGTITDGGSLTVAGTTSSTGLITGNNGLTITAGGAAITGNSTVTGNLNITGTTTSGGLITGNNGLTITGATNINTTGNAVTNINSGTNIGATTIGNTTGTLTMTGSAVSVTGPTSITGTLTVSNNTTVNGLLTANSGLNVSAGETINNGGLTVSAGGETINGSSTLNGSLLVTGTGQFNGLLTAAAGLTENGTATLTGQTNLNVSGHSLNIAGVTAAAPSSTLSYMFLDGSNNVHTSTVNVVTGSGTQNTIPVWNNATGTTLGNSSISDNGTTVSVNGGKLTVTESNGNLSTSGNINLPSTTSTVGQITMNNTPWMYNLNNNQVVGLGSGNFTMTGNGNTIIGNGTMTNNATGSNNTLVGDLSMINNSTGSSNTALGVDVLVNNTSGSSNVGVGQGPLFANTTGVVNVAVGNSALQTNTTGSGNTAIGNGADVSTGGLSNATAIGSGAIVTASNTIQLGNGITNVNTSGTLNAAGLQATGTINSSGGVLQTACATRIDNGGNGTFASVVNNGAQVHRLNAPPAAYTVAANDYWLVLTVAGSNITLPPSAGNGGRTLIISNYSGGNATITAQGTDVIRPSTTVSISLANNTTTTLMGYNSAPGDWIQIATQ